MVDALVIQVVCSGVAACLMAIGCTYAAVRLGGAIGGLLAGMPHTVTIFSVAIAATTTSASALREGLWAVSVGTLIGSTIIMQWRWLPTNQHILRLPNLTVQILVMMGVSACVWLSGGVAYVFVKSPLERAGISIRAIGLTCWLLHLCNAIYCAVINPIPTPRGNNPITRAGYVFRGLAAGAVVSFAVYLANLSASVGAVASTLPVITCTMLISLMFSQPRAVAQGAASSTIPSLLAFAMFAAIFSELEPIFLELTGTLPGAIVIAVVVTLCITTTFISIPVFFLLRYNASRLAIRMAVAEEHQKAELTGDPDFVKEAMVEEQASVNGVHPHLGAIGLHDHHKHAQALTSIASPDSADRLRYLNHDTLQRQTSSVSSAYHQDLESSDVRFEVLDVLPTSSSEAQHQTNHHNNSGGYAAGHDSFTPKLEYSKPPASLYDGNSMSKLDRGKSEI